MRKRIFFFALAALLLSVSAFAQIDSLPIDTIDGQPMYRYQVQKAEGLYRISKNFGVSQDDLIRYNPSLQKDGLKLGQTLLIPVVQKIDSAQYVIHTLQPKETLYGLSRQYGVTVDELQKLNPGTKMTIGSQLLIKKKAADSSSSSSSSTSPSSSTSFPSSSKGESKMVPESERVPESEKAQEAHKSASGSALPLTTSNVPLKQEFSAPAPHDLHNVAAENALPLTTSNLQLNQQSPLPLRFAFLLPFMTDAPKRDANTDRFIDFYEGALLAVYEAQQSGQRFDIYAYDVQKSDVAVQQILQRGEMQNMDAIIGPAYPAQVGYAALFAKQNRIPLLVPFTSRVTGIEHNAFLMQFNPSAEYEAQAVCQHFAARKDSVHFVLIDANSANLPASVAELNKAVIADGFGVSRIAISSVLNDSLQYALADDKENILVFPSDKYSAVQVLMPKILEQKKGRQLTLYGHYAWAAERASLPMVYPTIFHEPDAAALLHYETLYRHYFGHALSSTSPRYDLLGYDLTKALIFELQHAHLANSEAERDAIFANTIRGIQSDVAFPRIEGGGRVNTAIHIVRK